MKALDWGWVRKESYGSMWMEESTVRILHVLDHSPPVHSGYAFRSQSLLLAQKRRGWDPIAVTSPKHYSSWNGHWRETEEIGSLRYYRTRKVWCNAWPLESELRIMITLAKRIHAITVREAPDLLHAHSPILNGIPALWISWRLGIPLVYEVRALWEDAAVDHGTYGPYSWRYKLVKALETWVCRKAEQVTVISDGLRDDLIERGVPPDKLTVVPNGVDVDLFCPRTPDRSRFTNWNLQGKTVIGFIGSFFRYEGLDLLVAAMARLTNTRSDVVLLLVGGGEMEAELKEQITRLNLEQHVVMPGSIPQDSIADIYALVDVLVCPRHSIRLTEVVTPLKPLEAMAMGRAVLASDVGGHRELIQNGLTGLLFAAGSVSALVQALERLLDDSDFRHALGTQGAAWVRQERLWDKTTGAYAEVYSKALESGRSRLGGSKSHLTSD